MPASTFLDIPDGTDITVGNTTTQVPRWYEVYQQGILNRGNTIANQPYVPYNAPRLANPQNNADITGSRQMIRNNSGKGTTFVDIGSSFAHQGGIAGDSFSAAEPFFTRAGASSARSAAQPFLTSGTASVANQVGGKLDAASERYIDNVPEYLNPYMDAAVGNHAQLMSRNLTENILPNVNQTFTGAGQFGSTRHGDFTGRAIRDTQEGISRTAADMLAQGYKDSAAIHASDMGRKMDATKSLGAFMDSDAQRNLQAGSTAAGAAGQDASLQAQMGSAAGTMHGNDALRRIQAGSTLGQLGQTRTQTAINDAAAMEGIGYDQLDADQRGLDLAYGDWQNQQNWPLRQLQIMQSLMSGQPIPGSGTTTTTATPAARTNPLAMLAGAMAGMYGMNYNRAAA
jgi:hypothetical protein